jgi:hypothetical protein
MPQLAFQLGSDTQKPIGGIYEASDVGKVELKDESLTVEMILSDPIPTGPGVSRTGTVGSDVTVGRTDIDVNNRDQGYQVFQGGSDPMMSFEDTALFNNADPTASEGIVTSDSVFPNRPFIPKQDAGVAPVFVPPTLEESSCLAPEQPINPTTPPVGPTPPPPPPPTLPSIQPPPKGRYFYEPECDTCCHAPADSPAQFYSMCLLVSTDPIVTKMVEGGMIDEVYASISSLQSRFEKGIPGAHLQKTNFIEFTSQKSASIVNETGMLVSPASKKDISSYQFHRNYNFKIPPNCQHLTLFTFVTMDQTLFNEHYQISGLSLPEGAYTGPIKQVSVITNSNLQTSATAFINPATMEAVSTPVQRLNNGSYFTYTPTKIVTPKRLVKVKLPVGNLRSDQVLARMIKLCSTSITDAISYSLKSNSTEPQNKFWLSRNPDKTNTLYMMYNQAELIMLNSFIKNLKSKDVYLDQDLLSLEIEKVDLYDEENNEIINSTIGTRSTKGSRIQSNTSFRTKKLSDQETISSSGGRIALATLIELPSQTRGIKFLQVSDSTPTSGKIAYRAIYKFKDPTIEFLKRETKEYMDKLSRLQSSHNKIFMIREDIKKGMYDDKSAYTEVMDASKSAIAKAVSILNILPNNEFNPTYFVNYLASLANPKATGDDHNDLMKVLRTLEQTLIGLLRSTGTKIDGIDDVGPITETLTVSKTRSSVITAEIQSQEFIYKDSAGVDFLSLGDTLEGTVNRSIYDPKHLDLRADIEFQKFWNTENGTAGINEAALRNQASFMLTPSKLYGVDEVVNFDKQQTYNFAFEQKVKKIKLASNNKPTKTNAFYTILDSLDNLPASFQIVPGDFDFAYSGEEIVSNQSLVNKILPNQTNFENGNIDTVKNRRQEITKYDSLSDKTLVSVESAFVEGFTRLGEGSVSDDLNANTSLEQVVDSVQISSLPPSLQAYKLRTSDKSKLSTFVNNFGLLSDPSNMIYQKNYFGIVGKLQYANMKPSNLNSLEWIDLDKQTISSSKSLFCRVVPMEDKLLQVGMDSNVQIYNEFFVVQGSNSELRGNSNTNNIRPARIQSAQSSTRVESSISERIQAIMNQKTTYNTGVPVAYTKIIY